MRGAVNRQGGFTYLMLLWWVAISGVMLMALAQRWSTEAQREQEKELVFRGEQIRLAIEAYASVPVSEGMSPYPQRLEDLLHDERTQPARHHLRRLWPDPLTGAPWGLIQGPQGVQGVYSSSGKTPLGAPDNLQRFEDWRFVARAMTPASAASTAPVHAPEQPM